MDMSDSSFMDPVLGDPAMTDSLPAIVDIRKVTQAQLMALGMAELAYVKPVWMDGTTAFAIFAADGSPMAVAADRDLALQAIVQHEMIPSLVH